MIEGLTEEQCSWIEKCLHDAIERLSYVGANNLYKSLYIIESYRKRLEKAKE